MRLFDHEKLKVYQDSLVFVAAADSLIARLPKGVSVRNQLDRASTSIPLNIAEGNGRYGAADRCRFFDIARGSALECAAALDVTVAKNLVNQAEIANGKELLRGIVAMLVGLIRANSSERVFEEAAVFRA